MKQIESTKPKLTHKSMPVLNNGLAEVFFYLDLSDEGYWLIKSKDGKKYTAGYDKQKVQDLIKRLNESHRPNIHQVEMHEILVCWNYHEKGEKCDYITELKAT